MAIQTLDTRKPLSAGQQITKGLVSGLGDYLNRAAESKLKEIEAQRVAQGLQGLGFAPEEAEGLANLPPELQKQLLSKKTQQANQAQSKESQKYYQTLSKEGQGAKENDVRLQKMKQLISTGKLTNPAFAGLLKTLNKGIFGFGIDLSGLLNKESQQFDKLSADFIRGAKNVFGGQRLTDNDINLFLKTVPSLTQSNEGKIAIINHLESINKASELRKNTANAIIRANGGVVPSNLEFLIEETIGPELDRLSEEFAGKPLEKVAGTQTLVGSLGRGLGSLIAGSS